MMAQKYIEENRALFTQMEKDTDSELAFKDEYLKGKSLINLIIMANYANFLLKKFQILIRFHCQEK
jgi:hypothetical protein